MRLVHIMVICALIVAASLVYKIKFDSTLQASRVAKLRHELRKERDAIAALKAEWARLDSPARIQGLAERHLGLKPLAASQFADFDALPMRPPPPPPGGDPISVMIEAGAPAATGSVPAPGTGR